MLSASNLCDSTIRLSQACQLCDGEGCRRSNVRRGRVPSQQRATGKVPSQHPVACAVAGDSLFLSFYAKVLLSSLSHPAIDGIQFFLSSLSHPSIQTSLLLPPSLLFFHGDINAPSLPLMDSWPTGPPPPPTHHARMFGLRAAVAIRLRSINTGSSDFVLEFFLPKNCVDPDEQKELLTSLSTIIQNVCWSLRVVTDKEIEEEEEEALPVDKFVIEENAAATNKPAGGDRRRTKAEKAITLEMLQQYFSGSLKDAARKIGVCPTTLKRICRQHGITRWPSRKLKKVGHSLQKLQHVIDSVQGTSGTLQIGSFYSSFPALASPNVSRTGPFATANNPADEQRKQSSSGSHSSSSSQCCSSASQPKLAVAHENATTKKETAGSGGSSLKRVRSEAGTNAGDHHHNHRDHDHNRNKLLPKPRSHKSSDGPQPVVAVVGDGKDSPPPAPAPPPPRIKVAYGEDKIRFRLQRHWGYKDLSREICRRFGIEDEKGFHLKYLDDDFEWVLLTCDADLQECVDVSRSSLGDTIKLSLVRLSS